MRKPASLLMTVRQIMCQIVCLATLPALLSGCHGIIWGNLAMLAIAVGIFMGTLSLGRE